MKSLLIIASVIALAVAGPAHRGLVEPGPAGPAPAPEFVPIAIGPAILDFEPVAIGPAVIDSLPISVGPAIIDSEPVAVGPAIIEEPIAVSPVHVVEEAAAAPSNPLVQIVLNINGVSHVLDPVSLPGVEPVVVPSPVHVVEAAPEPVQVIEVAPEPVNVVEIAPVEIGAPVFPTPVLEPVVIGAPQLPQPVEKH